MAEYIEREAAKAVLNKRHEIRTHMRDLNSALQLKIAELEIGDIPAADVRPVTRGKWEDVEVTYVAGKTTLPFERISSMRCNQCNRYHTEIYYYGNPTEMAHYCPNCGADMREES